MVVMTRHSEMRLVGNPVGVGERRVEESRRFLISSGSCLKYDEVSEFFSCCSNAMLYVGEQMFAILFVAVQITGYINESSTVKGAYLNK